MVRPPTELLMRHESDCVTCVVAQVLHIFDREIPPLADIDKMTVRTNDEALSDRDAYRLLIAAGFMIYEFSSFHHDIFADHGLAYLKRFYGKDWTTAHDEYYTEQRVTLHQLQTMMFLRTVQMAPNAYFRINSAPTLSIVQNALQSGAVVDVTMAGLDPLRLHAALLAPSGGMRGIRGWLYDPKSSGATVSPLDLDELWPRLILDHGVAIIRPR